jgi:hypothetical protein
MWASRPGLIKEGGLGIGRQLIFDATIERDCREILIDTWISGESRRRNPFR